MQCPASPGGSDTAFVIVNDGTCKRLLIRIGVLWTPVLTLQSPSLNERGCPAVRIDPVLSGVPGGLAMLRPFKALG